ncbi:hypothetical protein [[Eubacterium] cellulosolvens]
MKTKVILSLLLIMGGALVSLTPINKRITITETLTTTSISSSIRTVGATIAISTFASRLTINHWGGQLPSAVSEVSFYLRNQSLVIHLEVERKEGLKYPYTYGVFLSEKPDEALYCIVMNPWFIRVPEAFLLEVKGVPFDEVLPTDISIYPRKDMEISFREMEMEASVPLSDLDMLTKDSRLSGFYTWVHVWALGNERYLFDFIEPAQISFDAFDHTRTYKIFTTRIELTTRTASLTVTSTSDQKAYGTERLLATVILIIMGFLMIVYEFYKRGRKLNAV